MEDSKRRRERLKAMRTVAAEAEASSYVEASPSSSFLANPLIESPVTHPAQEAPATPRFDFYTDPTAVFSANKKRNAPGNPAAQLSVTPANNSVSPMARFSSPHPGVSNCYVFKSRLQEYAQKKGLPTPVYETIKEGPSHEPSFRSTVIVKDVRYDSLPGFFNRKAAEQSAAEVALLEMAKSDEVNECISQPVHETGLCKNLLQEYAQKMNYAIPVYICQKNETPGRATHFKCTVEIGGIQYIGASAKTKKEAEIKAARTALLAIQSSASDSSHKSTANHQLTVIPFRKRGAETASVVEETANVPKPKKGRFKKKMLRKKFSGDRVDHNQGEIICNLDVTTEGQLGSGSESDKTDALGVQGTGHLLPIIDKRNLEDGRLASNSTGDVAAGALTCHISGDFGNGLSVTADFTESSHGMPTGISAESNGDATKVSGLTFA